MKKSAATDWEACHRNPFPAACLTRKITAYRLKKALQQCGMASGKTILELGGGASSFQQGLRCAFSPVTYTAADNCVSSLEKLPSECERLCCDLLTEPEKLPEADLVFSVGLIEHFTEEKTRQLVRLHLEKTRSGGLTAILFPTPTLLYRTARRLAESLDLWCFPDERPLKKEEVISAAGSEPVFSGLILANIFTQQILIFRKK